ncbi:MAG: hypothetical protein ACM3S1_06915 [Hyphomicrobiales bacterium]
MDTLRSRRANGKTFLQTPVVHLRNGGTGQRATLVLTAHLGEARYFERLRNAISASPGQIFFESVRSRDSSEAHWHERYHHLLRRIREDIYRDIAGLGLFTFQGEALAPDPFWINADVDCCQLAARLRQQGVSTLKYDLALDSLSRLVRRARSGNAEAAKTIESLLKYGLLFISAGFVFEALRWLPGTRKFQAAANDWRNEFAARTVLDQAKGDWVLIYGAAHGPGLLRLFRKAGYHETHRDWLTVFTT